jgi:hypothetical protein
MELKNTDATNNDVPLEPKEYGGQHAEGCHDVETEFSLSAEVRKIIVNGNMQNGTVVNPSPEHTGRALQG